MRFTIRDVLWLTVVVGLAIAWRLELKERVSGSEELKRIQAVAEGQEEELDSVELSLQQFGPPKRWAKRRRQNREKEEALAGKYDPDKALVGEWEIVEMVYKGKVQDLQGKSAGWMTFQYGKWSEADSARRYSFQHKYTIVAPGEIDIDMQGLLGRSSQIWKCRYEVKDGRLWFIFPMGSERPTNLDAVGDVGSKLYVLQKAQ